MSGICALMARTQAPADPRLVTIMAAAAPYRGVAATARHTHPRAVLAQLGRREAAPAAPAVDPQTGVVVVADARIDNAVELRHLLGPDSPPATAGAATLIAAAYARWGRRCLARLVGDFAIALWDPRGRQLLLARDPMGMRALHYRIDPKRALVATDVAQLLAVPGVPDEPDERMVAAYMAGCFGSLDWSYHRGVYQVAPSHAVLVDDTTVRSWRYWDVDPAHHVRHTSERDYAEHLRALYLEAVRARIAGDRPVGVLLSGGMDSGAAAAAAGWLIEREGCAPRLHSYSWDYGAFTECDERHRSRHIVERYGITATDVPVEDAGPLAGYPAHAPTADSPFHGHFQTMLDRGFACAARDGVGPLLTGMRGDLAVGPVDEDYRTLLRAGRLLALGGELRRHRDATGTPLAALAGTYVVPAALSMARRRLAVGMRRGGVGGVGWRGGGGGSGPSDRRPGGGRRAAPAYPPWITPALARRVDLPALLDEYTEPATPALDGPLRRRRYQWLFMPMHLRWSGSQERRVATFGMESVDAWSDRRVAEFCLAVPQQVLDRPFATDKRLAREAMRGIMPEAIRRTATKTVPTPLFQQTLRHAAAPTVRALLTDSRAQAAGWLDAAVIRDSFEGFVQGGPPAGQLWWALSLEWWLRVREKTAERH